MTSSYLHIILLLGATMTIADAVRCYKCKSGEDTGCGVPLRPEGLATCKGTYCSMVDAIVKGHRYIIRDCQQYSSGSVGNDCTKTTSAKTCLCQTNYCNAHSADDWGSSTSRPCVHTNLLVTLTCVATLYPIIERILSNRYSC